MTIHKYLQRKRASHWLQFQRLEPRKVLTTLFPTVEPVFGPIHPAEYAAAENARDLENDDCLSSLMAPPPPNTGVVGRYVFYNDSAFDGNDATANAQDDNAIATDKLALFPGETAAFDNYTSFTKGINGILIDTFLTDPASFSANDIVLSSGIGNDLSDFTRLDLFPEISVRAGEGVNGSDRVTVILPNGSVVNEYLQVTVKAASTEGLTSDDIFFFGNVVAETGDSTVNTRVNLIDLGLVRENQTGFALADVDDPWDVNRDRRVNLSDVGLTRGNQTGFTSVPLIVAPIPGDDFYVASAQEIDDIISLVEPGDSITMANGFWTDQQIQFDAVGTEARPIYLRAESQGQVILRGSSTLNISGDWLVVDGLHFNGGALGSNDHIVEFRGNLGEATNSRFTNSAIIDYNPSDINTRYFWVSMYGQNNRVDHNNFSGQNHSGVTVTVWRDNSDADYHLIDNNHFANRPEGNANGFETIRIGTSDESLSDSFTTVESNLFEGTDGEIEIISNKSGSNIFRNNTFRESSGTLTLRHGDNNLVEGNFFLGEGKTGSGGVRVIGENQTIVNNYFEGLDGRAGAAISISAAVPNSALNEYYRVIDAVIAHNTIVNVKEAAILFDHGFGSSGRTLLAENVTIANNLISSTIDPLFDGVEGNGWSWEGNIAFGESLGPKAGDSGITVVDPQLVLDTESIWRLSSNSAAVNDSVGDYSIVTGGVDFDGQQRVGLYDVGADEFSAAAITRKPLVAEDVGNYWTIVPNNGGGECSCIAVHSDEYSSSLDPNNDGDSWTVESATDAIGGTTMVAPAGSLVNLPGTHDAVLTYDLEFTEAGTYMAYYRARGFSGSSNSMYTPSDFGVTPNSSKSLSSDGVYRWDTGITFDVSSSDLSGSVEFQIGKREAGADFDAFVLHLDDNLSDAELDALFA